MPPLERIFDQIMKVEEIFSGDHTKSIKAQKVSKSQGIGMFFNETKINCLSCKAPLDH